jgi:hypothetical protein
MECHSWTIGASHDAASIRDVEIGKATKVTISFVRQQPLFQSHLEGLITAGSADMILES